MLIRHVIPSIWLQALIQCLLFKLIFCNCRFPSSEITNGHIIYSGANNEENDTAPDLYVLQFKCHRGYRLVGSSVSQCSGMDGNWTSEVPVCEKIFCDAPKPPANGIIPELLQTNLSTFPYNFRITYLCNEGYQFDRRGKTSKRCVSYGWSGKPLNCIEKKKCTDPGVSIHGKVLGKCRSAGNKLYYSCLEGYEMIGNEKITCLSTGQWSSTRPLCRPLEAYCELPPNIPNGVVIGVKDGDYFLEANKLQILCELGFKYTGSELNVLCKNGEWTSEFGECVYIFCEAPAPPANGFISELLETNTSTFPYNFRINYDCNEGYRLVGGDSGRFCGKNGWTGITPYCLDTGQYNFDNGAPVTDILNSKAAELDAKLPKSSPTASAVGKFDINLPGRLIIYFVFDVSPSVKKDNFDKSIEFAKAVVRKVGISENGTRAGVLTFSSPTAENVFLPLDFKSTDDVLDALDKTEYKVRRSQASSALAIIREECIPLTHAFFGRNVRNVIFVLTDGFPTADGRGRARMKDIVEAYMLKDAGVEIYCIGISDRVRESLLHQIASKSKDNNRKVFILKNYSSTHSLLQDIMKGYVDYSQCGLSMESDVTEVNRGKIVGGNKSEHPWPWMAALFMPYRKSNRLYTGLQCGGSIITEKFILTAAHCMYYSIFENQDKKDITVKLGLTDVNNDTYLQEFKVEEMLIHPKYRHGTSYDYDIALLQLDRKIVFNAFVRPICLPPSELPLNSTLYSSDEFGWAVGWGYNRILSAISRHPARASQYLKEIELPLQPRHICIQSLVDQSFVEHESYFTNRMFCAGDRRGGNDTCKGDSGGPMMQLQMNSEGYFYWTQVGIISWGIGCGLVNNYGFYTHVQSLRPWIDSTIFEALAAAVGEE